MASSKATPALAMAPPAALLVLEGLSLTIATAATLKLISQNQEGEYQRTISALIAELKVLTHAVSEKIATQLVELVTNIHRSLPGFMKTCLSTNPNYISQTNAETMTIPRPGYDNVGSKNDRHSNLNRRINASQNWEAARRELESLKRMPNKNPQIKEQIDKKAAEVRRLQNQKDFSGETHGRRGKTNKH
ncbi:MAG: hypothetical protein AB7F59_08585 [Bdellovibrionales bacterium]